MNFPPGCKVKEFVEHLRAQYPQIGELVLQKKVLVSVNQEIAHWDTEISNSDEIALLPPFAGGSHRFFPCRVFMERELPF